MKLKELYLQGGKVVYKYVEDAMSGPITPQGQYILDLFEDCAMSMYAFFQEIELATKIHLDNIFDGDFCDPVSIEIADGKATYYGEPPASPSHYTIELDVLQDFEENGQKGILYHNAVKNEFKRQLGKIIERNKQTMIDLEKAMEYIKSQFVF